MPRISAVLPNYNHGRQIGRAMDALLGQSLPLTELVVVDDGSTDDSMTVIAARAETDPRVKVLRHSANLGAIAALNTGLSASTGEYVYMAAADDRILPQAFETLHGALSPWPEAAFAAGEVFVMPGRGRRSLRPIVRPSQAVRFFDAAATARLLRRMDNVLLTGAALIRRQAIAEAGGLRESLSSFADGFLLRQLAFRHGFVFVPQVLAEWHVSADGLSRSAATDLARTQELEGAAMEAIATSSEFPPGYSDTLRRRWRFAALRLAIQAGTAEGATAEAFMPGPAALRRPLLRLAKGGVAGRTLSLAWASMWYRPYPAGPLARTAFSRAFRAVGRR